MASIFDVIKGLDVTQEDIVEAELFAEQYLSAQFPTYDFRQGTALRDMTIRPNATLLALVQKAITHYFDSSDIINITDETDNSIVDKRLSNFFITRSAGKKSVVNARLFFSFPTQKPMNVIVPSSAFFSMDNETKFFPKGNITVYAEKTGDNFYFRFDGAYNMHYVDIELESAQPTESANISEGDLLYFTVFSPYFLKANIQYLISDAIEEESNERMVDRAYTSISTRNLINKPSIIAHILDKFNYVKSVYPVGLGDSWMYRDMIKLRDIDDESIVHSYHRGGHVDVYVDTKLSDSVVQLTAVEADDGKPVFYVNGPIVSISRSSSVPGDRDPDTVHKDLPFKYTSELSEYDSELVPLTPDDDIGLSANHVIRIEANSVLAPISVGDTATFSFKSFSGVIGINNGINGDDCRVVCANCLVRSFVPVMIDVKVNTRGHKVSDKVSPKVNLDKYVSSIDNGGSLYVSEIINILIDSGIKDFKLPIEVSACKYSKNISGTDEGPTGVTSENIVDSKDLLDIQKFYLRDIIYTED